MVSTMKESHSAIRELEVRRTQLVEELLSIRSLVRGSLTEQFIRVPRKGTGEYKECGPYYVLCRSQQGKTKSERVKKKDAQRVKEDIAQYKRFEDICRKLAEVTEQLGELEREASADETVKKKPKSHSKRARKSSGS